MRKGVLCGIVLLLALAGCARHGEDPEESPAAHPDVTTTTVREVEFTRELEAPGEWRSSTEVTVQAPFDAVVEALTPRPGERVERGHAIGTWQTWESAAALQGAELMVREARDSAAANEARRALAHARAGLVRVPIVAPVTGTVVRRGADPGARLSSGAELLALIADGDVVFEARVRSMEARALRPGMDAVIDDSLGPPRQARTVAPQPTAGADQATLVWLRPLAPLRRPALGSFGRARIRLGAPYRALAVPDSAVVEDDLTGRRRVAVVDSAGRLQWIEVALGARAGTWREVEGAGLAAGRRVITEGQWALPAGTAVRVRS